MNMPITMEDEPSELDVEQQIASATPAAEREAPRGPVLDGAARAALRRAARYLASNNDQDSSISATEADRIAAVLTSLADAPEARGPLWRTEANRLLVGMFREESAALRSMWAQDLKRLLGLTGPAGGEIDKPDAIVQAEENYRRGVNDGGRIVFDAVMGHESNAGRGMDLYLALKDVAADALAEKIIAQDPDEQPLWEHLIQEAYFDFRARQAGIAPYGERQGQLPAFTAAARAMLMKKLPAPDSENLQLREALCLVLDQLGKDHALAPLSPLKFLVGVPAAVRDHLAAGADS